MTDDKALTPVLDAFEEIPNKSMAKDIVAILQGGPAEDAITKEEAQRWQRFAKRLADAGKYVSRTWYYRSQLAIEIYQLHQEKDYEIFDNLAASNAERASGRFSSWVEFSEVLSGALGISPRTINNYLKYRKVGLDVLKLGDDEFLNTGGALCVDHILDICTGHDGRRDGDLRERIRPKTLEVQATMNAMYPEMEFPDQLASYYREHVAQNLSDPSAINKSPRELAEQARTNMGAPKFSSQKIMDGGTQTGIAVTVIYPDREIEGLTLLGRQDVYNLLFQGTVEGSVLDWVNGRLRAFSSTYLNHQSPE